MRDLTTKVVTMQVPGKTSVRVLFGDATSIEKLTVSQPATASSFQFRPWSVVGLSRRRLNSYGTTHHEVIVFRCPEPGDEVSVIHGVEPGGIVLLHATGANAARALRTFELAEELGIKLVSEESLLRDLDLRLNGRVFPERFIRRFVKERDV